MIKVKDFKKALIMLGVFLVYTILVKTIDVQAIGPNGSEVGFASLNGAVFALIGSHEFFFNISELIGYFALAVCVFFGVIGLLQLVKRKSFKKVDSQIITLGIFYIVVIALYVFFNVVAVNYRPILEADGTLESSFPSSHTMLAVCVFAAAAFYTRFLPERFRHLRQPLIKVCYIFIAVMIVSRVLSGVHWFTDIIGGIILSLALINALVTAVGALSSGKDYAQ